MNPEIEERATGLYCRICGRKVPRTPTSQDRHVSNDQRVIRLLFSAPQRKWGRRWKR